MSDSLRGALDLLRTDCQRPHRFRLQALVLGVCLLSTARGEEIPSRAEEVRSPQIAGWKLVWEDQFDGDKLNLDEWEPIRRKDSHNNEKQYYLPEQIQVIDGVLRITATDEALDGKSYRSGRLRTYRQWSLGRFEARIRLPKTQGMWPAFWLLPRDVRWPEGGEIDIMEAAGGTPRLTSSAYHWGASGQQHRYLSRRQKLAPADERGRGGPDDFHTYACEWEPDAIRFFVDGAEHFVVTADDAPLHAMRKAIVINLAVGGFYGGDPDESTVFPQRLDVDYVRVWRRSKAPD